MPGAELLGFTGKLPVDAHVDAQNIFGMYFKKSTSTLDNGRSAYVSADANRTRLPRSARGLRAIADIRNGGSAAKVYA